MTDVMVPTDRATTLERLTRGGLSQEAARKAADALEAGDIYSLNFAVTKNGAVVCPIPFELLVKCFPQLSGLPQKGGRPDAEELRGMRLEYTINRHRGGKKSLTIRWPGEAEAVEPAANGEPPESAPL
ncbi:MAG: hypothetical protein V3T71_02470 [Dehalococcoidia bacterium]